MLHPDLEAQVRRELAAAWMIIGNPRSTVSQRSLARAFLSTWGIVR
jgi:hypothetical protein